MKNFDEESMKNREDTVFDLTERWECLVEDQREEEFDRESFCKLAVDTFQFIYPLNVNDEGKIQKGDIPRDVLQMLLLAKEFASSETFISHECEAAHLVAEAFCSQMADGWIAIDDGFSKDRFAVEGCSGFFAIDTTTFDLSDIIEDLEANFF